MIQALTVRHVGQGSVKGKRVQQGDLYGHEVCLGFGKDGRLVLVAFKLRGAIMDVKYALRIKDVAAGLESIWEVGTFEGKQ